VFLDWIGSLRIRRRGKTRVELCLTRATAVAGWVLTAVGTGAGIAASTVSLWLAAVPALIAGAGLLLASLDRTLIFDRDDGLLRIEQTILGITTRAAIPIFHLRAVVLAARVSHERGTLGPRFVAYIDRRVGLPIHLDESRRAAQLKPMVEAIAEVTELRLVYDIAARAAGSSAS
jgi:hypothetical protein